jgi:hypothetical protein
MSKPVSIVRAMIAKPSARRLPASGSTTTAETTERTVAVKIATGEAGVLCTESNTAGAGSTAGTSGRLVRAATAPESFRLAPGSERDDASLVAVFALFSATPFAGRAESGPAASRSDEEELAEGLAAAGRTSSRPGWIRLGSGPIRSRLSA